jgi:hypothetical protein
MGVKGITLQLDKERHLRLTLRSLEAFKEKTGKDILKGGLKTDDFEVRDWATLICLSLQHEDPELTVDYVMENFELADFLEAMKAILKAFKKQVASVPGGAAPLAPASEEKPVG